MRGGVSCALVLLLAVASGAVVTSGQTGQAQQRTDPGAAELRRLTADPLYVLEDSYLKWPLLPSLQAYGRIDGVRLKQYVKELAAISQKSRDAGNPVWGRVVGTPYDEQTQQWLTGKFKQLGLQPRSEELALEPVWRATSWEMSISGGDRSLTLSTTRPVLQAVATPAQGIELQAAWAGLGTEADFRDRDVRGKVVFLYSIPQPGTLHYSARGNGAIRRAEDKGAAAIVIIIAIPGNVTNQLWSRGEHVPMFSMGLQDGEAVRQLIEQAPAGQAPKVKIRLETRLESGLKTASIWAVLPGTTEENILVMAHFDGWFYAALDNASGVATMLGLAEYFAKVPKEQRRRTITFVGFSAHEMPNSGYPWAQWMVDKKQDVLSRTALIVNCEHTAETEIYVYGDMLRKANTVTARRVSVGHSKALAPIIAQALASFGVSTYAELDSAPLGEIQRFFKFAPGFQTIRDPVFYHSDADTPDTVPATGLEAITRAYAKIIDDTNRLDVKSIVEGVATARPGGEKQ
jgi:hypothetical protein